MRLLLVEDDDELAGALRAGLSRRGLESDRAASVGDAEQMLAAARYALVLLDLGLPDGDGLALVRRLRAARDPIPVLVVTARSDLPDRVTGLNAGADDYLVKPFDLDELVARLRAVLRRQAVPAGARLSAGDVSFDPLTGELFVGDASVSLSQRERQLAELLLRRLGQVVSKALAEDQMFGLEDPVGSNAVEVYVHRLRRRLAAAGAGVRIETIRGVGYLLRAVP